MTDQLPYRRVVTYRFKVCNTLLEITDWGKNYVAVEEVAKNGQEDTHMSGVLVADSDGVFTWQDGEDGFIAYHSGALADGIREYLTTHGFPSE